MIRKTLALLATLTGVVFTANGYRSRRSGLLSLMSFAYGLFATELPLQSLAGQLGVTSLVTRRLPRRWRGVCWLLSGLSAAGLLALDRIGHKANVPLATALDEGLGAQRRTDTTGLWQPPAPHGATVKSPGVARMLRIHRDYAHDADLPYGPYGGANKLDIWRRPDLAPGGRAPVLLQVPGGAWATGNKRGQAHPLMSNLAEHGWVCVSINYRLSPRNTWPAHIVDVKRALAWVKQNIAMYGGDPDFIAITGGSAGGHLSALAALTPNDPRFQPGFEDVDTHVQAAVPFYGVFDFIGQDALMHPMLLPFIERSVVKQMLAHYPQSFEAASPLTYVNADAPPFFILHGTNDSLVPVEQGRVFSARLREVSTQPVAYAELPCAQHAFDMFGSARAAHAALAVEQFLAEVYRR